MTGKFVDNIGFLIRILVAIEDIGHDEMLSLSVLVGDCELEFVISLCAPGVAEDSPFPQQYYFTVTILNNPTGTSHTIVHYNYISASQTNEKVSWQHHLQQYQVHTV